MSEIIWADPAAMAVIEGPNSFIGIRAALPPDQLTRAGSVALLGDFIGDHQTPHEVIRTQLIEQLGLGSQGVIRFLKNVDFRTQGYQEKEVVQYVSLMHVALAVTNKLTLRGPGELAYIPKTAAGIELYENELTPIALQAFRRALTLL